MNEPGYVVENRAQWNALAPGYEAAGRRAWTDEPSWGIWDTPEADLGLLRDVAGLDALELGCGTAYVSAWLDRLGARPVGIDNSPAQLANARSLQREFGRPFPLVWGDAEHLPFADASFDFAISEYGACLWCDPYRWLPEAARVLRPGGRLAFLTNSALLMLCVPEEDHVAAGNHLLRDYHGMHRFAWPDEPGIEFHLGHGDWVRLFRANGLAIEDLIEVRVPANASTRHDFVTAEWAARWPSEEVWVVRKEAR